MKRGMVAVIGVVIVMMCGLAANAQDQSRQALAEELMNLMNTRQNIETSLGMFKQMLAQQMAKMQPPARTPEEAAKAAEPVEKIMDMITKELSWDKMKEQYINLYSETFTEPELKDIIAFYKSPSGQAFIKKQPEIMKRSMELTSQMVSRIMPKIQEMTKGMEEAGPPAAPAAPPTPPAGKSK